MVSIVLLIAGLILTGVGVITFITIGNAGFESVSAPSGMDPETVVTIVRYGVSGLLCGLGAIFSLSGIWGIIRRGKQRTLAARLIQSGIDAEGTVTFVDKNFRILVNQVPIYSIVEYTYRDSNGKEHTRRLENVSSEIVVRKQIQVGGKIPVKYARENPGMSVMILG